MSSKRRTLIHVGAARQAVNLRRYTLLTSPSPNCPASQIVLFEFPKPVLKVFAERFLGLSEFLGINPQETFHGKSKG